MTETHGVISRFLDNEEFDALELGTALAAPEGRELLIDLIALRQLVQETPAESARVRSPERRSIIRPLFAAAAVVLALVGGYQLGVQRQTDTTARSSAEAPPAPTIVVPAATEWQPAGAGR